ncbi:hypothetical protein AKJ38_02770 [candidate division MSBL1 archaeon SCGC-AAA259I14]|uniref:Uncharacterized protein n=2 Tax=candidate division MSBL1 TaxID=215777 RepID=A0A133UR96_9EURY|nr:hypothetical protein AKJ61_03300 [candidate division MSBL1 archaeon SCGC-AAA259B11]KXA96718.1 hypothetical protein AKJ38_02770 [candidate division MSBL1 archaeon SCGC-AAA259I14]
MPDQDIEEIVDKRMKEIKKEFGDRPIYGATREGFWSRIGWVDGISLIVLGIGLIILFLSLILELSGGLGELAIILSAVGTTASVLSLLTATHTWSKGRQDHIANLTGHVLEENVKQSAILQQQTQTLADIREALKK